MLKQIYLSQLKKVEQACKYKAFRLYLNESDLISAVNEKICVALLRNQPFECEAQAWAFIHAIIHNAALDIKRREKNCVELDGVAGKFSVTQKDIDLKNISRSLVKAIREELNPKHQLVFDDYFIADMKYKDVAERNNINIETIKGIILRIRAKANKNYGHLLEIIN